MKEYKNINMEQGNKHIMKMHYDIGKYLNETQIRITNLSPEEYERQINHYSEQVQNGRKRYEVAGIYIAGQRYGVIKILGSRFR